MKAVVAWMLLFSLPALAEVQGTLGNLSHEIKLGAAPGQDTADVNGTYQSGVGSNGFDFSQDVVTVSLDGGRFVQALPPGSFLPISGGMRYSSTGSGVRLLRIMNDGTFLLRVREADLSGFSSDKVENFRLVVGDDSFEQKPNSIPVGRMSAPDSALVGEQVGLSALSSTVMCNKSLSHFCAECFQPPLFPSLASLSFTPLSCVASTS